MLTQSSTSVHPLKNLPHCICILRSDSIADKFVCVCVCVCVCGVCVCTRVACMRAHILELAEARKSSLVSPDIHTRDPESPPPLFFEPKSLHQFRYSDISGLHHEDELTITVIYAKIVLMLIQCSDPQGSEAKSPSILCAW